MKICKACNQSKSDSTFALSTLTKSGLSSRCKTCESQRSKIRYKKFKKEIKEKAKIYRIENYARRLEIERKCRSKNKERLRPSKNARQSIRNRTVQSGTYLILDKELNKIYNSPCFNCGSTKDQSLDHIIPISKGGSHSSGNIMTLCLKCNISKKSKLLVEWKKEWLIGQR